MCLALLLYFGCTVQLKPQCLCLSKTKPENKSNCLTRVYRGQVPLQALNNLIGPGSRQQAVVKKLVASKPMHATGGKENSLRRSVLYLVYAENLSRPSSDGSKHSRHGLTKRGNKTWLHCLGTAWIIIMKVFYLCSMFNSSQNPTQQCREI